MATRWYSGERCPKCNGRQIVDGDPDKPSCVRCARRKRKELSKFYDKKGIPKVAIPLQNLIDSPDLLAKLMGPEIRCASCKEPICALTGINRSPKGLVCDDCYYSLISDEVEKYPPHKK